MAKKKAKVKRSPLQAMTHDQVVAGSGGIPSAHMGQIGPDLIGANIGAAQQISKAEQAQMVDRMRKKVDEKQKKNKAAGYPAGSVPTPTSAKAPVIPDGTFKNADNELVVGDLKKFQASQGMRRKKKVSKKRS